MAAAMPRITLGWFSFFALLFGLIVTTDLLLADPVTPSGSMTEPLRLIERAQQKFAEVQDYTCDFIKRERVGNALQEPQFVRMKVRHKPFSVHLRWELPKSLAGQEACYVAGRNSGRMRVKPNKGLVSLVGWMSLTTSDPRALRDSRHEITEAGLGHLLDQFSCSYEEEARLNCTTVHLATYEYAGRRCRRVETTHPNGTGRFLFHRSVLYFDLETGLPLRVENYDWPHSEAAEGELMECYSYLNLRANVGLTDDAFNY